MTLTRENDLGSFKKNQRAKYLDQRPFSSTVIARTHRQRIRLDPLSHV